VSVAFIVHQLVLRHTPPDGLKSSAVNIDKFAVVVAETSDKPLAAILRL